MFARLWRSSCWVLCCAWHWKPEEVDARQNGGRYKVSIQNPIFFEDLWVLLKPILLSSFSILHFFDLLKWYFWLLNNTCNFVGWHLQGCSREAMLPLSSSDTWAAHQARQGNQQYLYSTGNNMWFKLSKNFCLWLLVKRTDTLQWLWLMKN